jgi:eukaryotic-like serine/threonine-protein kinase
LNHPHIATIHGLEEAGERKFLVMELASGETLAERIARGPIPLPEALKIALQISDALQAAHEKGVVHRDLKPANVKISPDNKVKVLDFGLAKAFEGQAHSSEVSNSPTISMAGTSVGIILGTASYMSPEQARGAAVDARSDIFSLGAVLYEMLTGQRAFAGDTVSDILAAVLKVEPDWNRLPPDTPAGIRRLLRLCLQKDPNRRLHTAADVRIEIEEIERELESAPAPTRDGNARPRAAWFATSLATVLALVFAILYFRSTPAIDTPELRLEVATPATPSPDSFALSPDGKRIVFLAGSDGQSRLWVRSLDDVTLKPLPGTEGATFPFWSPDSRSIGSFANVRLKRIDINGGLPQTLATLGGVALGGAWNSDGMIVFSSTASAALFRVSASGGEAAAFTKIDPPRQRSHSYPQFLPDGHHFIFRVTGSPEGEGIYWGSIDSGETKRLVSTTSAGYYIPGWLLYTRQVTLVAQRFDPAHGELEGDIVTVADQVNFVSVSSKGVIAYRDVRGGDSRQLTWFDRSGKTLGNLGAADVTNLQNPSLAPDGIHAVVDRRVQGNQDLWLVDGTRTTRFTFDPRNDGWAVWSPDSKKIVFRSNRNGRYDLYEKDASTAAAEIDFAVSTTYDGQ